MPACSSSLPYSRLIQLRGLPPRNVFHIHIFEKILGLNLRKCFRRSRPRLVWKEEDVGKPQKPQSGDRKLRSWISLVCLEVSLRVIWGKVGLGLPCA
ncbi:hypothetical protein BDV11DRAFT_34725 [Aspergillus similis]